MILSTKDSVRFPTMSYKNPFIYIYIHVIICIYIYTYIHMITYVSLQVKVVLTPQQKLQPKTGVPRFVSFETAVSQYGQRNHDGRRSIVNEIIAIGYLEDHPR